MAAPEKPQIASLRTDAHGDCVEEQDRRSSPTGGASRSSVPETCLEVDLETGVCQTKLHLDKVERNCRICHLSLEAADQDSDVPIDLGCSCKGDLAASHKQCAEAWFKIRGNRTCEICGSFAQNVAGPNEASLTEPWNEGTNGSPLRSSAPIQPAEVRNFWQGHKFLNFLLGCMVFAFVVSWLFHFKMPS